MTGNLRLQKYGARVGYDEILIIGDSNSLEGKGVNGESTTETGYDANIDITHPSVFQRKRNGTTVLAQDPLDFPGGVPANQPISYSIPFARDGYIPGGSLVGGRKVRIQPYAVAGSSLTSGYWRNGGTGFNTAVAGTNAGIAESSFNSLKCILWVGGANDAIAGTDQATFLGYIVGMITDLRSQLTGGAFAPFAVSGFPHLMATSRPGDYGLIDAALRQVPSNVSNAVYVNTDSLAGWPVSAPVHFGNTAHRLMGPAFYNEISSLL